MSKGLANPKIDQLTVDHAGIFKDPQQLGLCGHQAATSGWQANLAVTNQG
jgi:hypothetical protein